MQYDWKRHPYTNICRHTGLTIPECSCRACTERQIARASARTQDPHRSRHTNPDPGSRRPLRLIATVGAVALAALGVPAVAGAKTTPVDGVRAAVEHGTLKVNGDEQANEVALRLRSGHPSVIEVDAGDNGSADFSFARDAVSAIRVKTREGDDSARIDDANGAFTDSIPTRVSGGRGDDSLTGGQVQVAAENETFIGRGGDDTVDGGKGNDTAFLGTGKDTFVWDPGEGSDVIEGGDGRDTMLFNGAAAAENVTLTANGRRLTFFRDVGTVTMDTNRVEVVAFNALGGADDVTVNDLTGTDVTNVNVDLAGTLGGVDGDGAIDNVAVNGTDGDDTIDIAGNGAGADVTGLAAATSVAHAERGDTLSVDTRGGADQVTTSGVFGTQVVVDGAAI